MVQIVFTIGGTPKFITKLNYTAEEVLFGEPEEFLNDKKRKFKIPLTVNKNFFKLFSIIIDK